MTGVQTCALPIYDDVTIELKVRDMAVYDYSDANKNTFKGYELDRGTYNIYLAKNAHESWAGDDTLSVRYSVSEAIKFEDENVKTALTTRASR